MFHDCYRYSKGPLNEVCLQTSCVAPIASRFVAFSRANRSPSTGLMKVM